MPEAVFRFDASPAIGFGHAVRCAALAGHLGALGWRSSAAIKGDAAPHGLWAKAFDRVVTLPADADDEGAVLRGKLAGCDFLVVDHYGWDARRERACRGWAKTIAVIDDLADRDHDCDILCDSALDRVPRNYAARVPRGTRLLLGPDYAQLRPSFAKARHQLRRSPQGDVHCLFVNVGATDHAGLLPRIIDGIELAGFTGTVDVMLALQAPGRAEVARRLECARFDGRLHVDAENVAELMADADLAIGAAGSTAWERCCLQLPSVIVVAVENQRHIAQGLVAACAAKLLPPGFSAEDLAGLLGPLLSSSAARAEMSRRAGRLCDGLGCARLTEAALFPIADRQGRAVSLRRADDRDKEILLQWGRARRDGIERDARAPSDAEHAAWFVRKLDDPACAPHVIEVNKAAAGFLLADFRRGEQSHELSIFVVESFRGYGVATAALAIIRRMMPSLELRLCVGSRAV